MRREDSDSNCLFSSVENSDREEETAPSCSEISSGCRCCQERSHKRQKAHCPHSCKIHTWTESLKQDYYEVQSDLTTRHSEGYGTEEECVLSDPQGDSDADADIEDTDCRLQAGSLQRISSRRRRRQRITRQDTTESEDDGGRSQRVHRWNLRLIPHRSHNRTILEESVSQVRPLVLCRPCIRTGEMDTCFRTGSGDKAKGPRCGPRCGVWGLCWWPPSLYLILVPLLFLPLLFIIIMVISFLLTWAHT